LTDSEVQSLIVDPNNTQTLYAGTSGGVFKSTDGGTGWAASSTGLTGSDVWSLAIDSSGILYAGTYGNGLFRLAP
jgi:ligand-binding sensor domain-containing protein